MSKHFWLILSIALLAGGLSACGNPCAELRKSCDVCSDATTTGKDACNLIANAGVAEACQAAIDRKTFDKESEVCANPCDALAKQCPACRKDDGRQACEATVSAGSANSCREGKTLYASGSSACTP